MLAIALVVLSSCTGVLGSMNQQIQEEQNKPARWEFKVVSIKDVNSYEKMGMLGTITETAPAGKIYKEIVVTVKNNTDKEQYLGSNLDSISLYTKKGAASIKEELSNDNIQYCHLGAGESTNVTLRFEVPEGTKLTAGAYIQYIGSEFMEKPITFPVSE